jgi:hypothetical protein
LISNSLGQKEGLTQKKEGTDGAGQLKISKERVAKNVDTRKKKFQTIAIILFLFLKEEKIQ